MAIVGVRGRGSQLAPAFAARSDCRIAYVCDVDSRLFGPISKTIADAQGGKQPTCVQDFRKALDDKSVDAMIIATPDHWHVPAAIWSCQAGKDVYVEKPVSHNCWEGRKLVEAARKYNRVVQVGMQNRSAAYNMAAKKYIDDGKLGRIHFCRVFNQKEWPNFPLAPDAAPPAELRLGHVERPGAGEPLQRRLRQLLESLLALLGRRHGQRRHPSDRPGPLGARARLSKDGPFGRRPFRQSRSGGNARHADDRLGVPQHDRQLRADALHAVHAQNLSPHPRVRRQVSLLAAMCHANRDLWERRSDVLGTARRRLAGLHAAETSGRSAGGTGQGSISPIPSTKRTLSTASAPANDPTPTSKKGTAAPSGVTMPTSAIASAASGSSLTPRQNRSSTMPRR